MGYMAAGIVARVLFPGRAEVCFDVLRITIWALPASGAAYMMGYAMNAAGKDRVQTRITLISQGVGLLMTIALVLRFGLIGACWSFLARPCISACLLAAYAAQRSSTRHAAGAMVRELGPKCEHA